MIKGELSFAGADSFLTCEAAIKNADNSSLPSTRNPRMVYRMLDPGARCGVRICCLKESPKQRPSRKGYRHQRMKQGDNVKCFKYNEEQEEKTLGLRDISLNPWSGWAKLMY